MQYTPLFLDFEASSLAPNSWPIELGMAWIDPQGVVQSTGCLIRPHSSWSDADWWPSSQKVHGITRTALGNEGLACHQAAELFLTHTAGRLAISDNPSFEARWLQRLLDAAQVRLDTPLPIIDLHTFFTQTLQPSGLYAAWEYLQHHHIPHRAEADARRIAYAWIAGLNQDQRQQPIGS